MSIPCLPIAQYQSLDNITDSVQDAVSRGAIVVILLLAALIVAQALPRRGH